MKTAQSIETSEERKAQSNENDPDVIMDACFPRKAWKRGRPKEKHERINPNAWKPGQSGNPSGRPKNDIAREIAKAVFENNREKLYKAFARAALKGNAYAFSQLADRAYGKMKETVSYELGGDYRDASTQSLEERLRELQTQVGMEQLEQRIRQLEAQLGIAQQIDDIRGDQGNTIRALPATCETKD